MEHIYSTLGDSLYHIAEVTAKYCLSTDLVWLTSTLHAHSIAYLSFTSILVSSKSPSQAERI